MNPDLSFTWMLIGASTIMLSVQTTFMQKMIFSWTLILGSFIFIIIYALKKND